MEFVCRVGTPAGDVVERTFVAADESVLRSDLEQQGFYLFQIKRGLGMAPAGAAPQGERADRSCCSARSWPRC